MSILLIVLRDWAFWTFKRRPILATLALLLVTALSGFSYAVWLYDLTVWDETDLWPIINAPNQ